MTTRDLVKELTRIVGDSDDVGKPMKRGDRDAMAKGNFSMLAMVFQQQCNSEATKVTHDGDLEKDSSRRDRRWEAATKL